MTTPFAPHCVRCAFRSAPVVCSRCRAVAYCSEIHQKDDTQRHRKGTCRQVVEARERLRDEEAKLRALPPDGTFLPENVFEQGAGDFYSIHDTRAFMSAKLMLVVTLADVGSHCAMAEALEHASEALRLDEQDHLDFKDPVPAMLVLMGKYQEAYDFIRYWATVEDEDDDEEEVVAEVMEEELSVAPCFRKTGGVMTESLDVFKNSSTTTAFHLATLTYIKLLLHFGINGAIQKLETSEDQGAKDEVMKFLEANNLPTDRSTLTSLRDAMEKQADEAFLLAFDKNRCLWAPIAMPKMLFKSPISGSFEPNSREEVRAWLTPYTEMFQTISAAVKYVHRMEFSTVLERVKR